MLLKFRVRLSVKGFRAPALERPCPKPEFAGEAPPRPPGPEPLLSPEVNDEVGLPPPPRRPEPSPLPGDPPPEPPPGDPLGMPENGVAPAAFPKDGLVGDPSIGLSAARAFAFSAALCELCSLSEGCFWLPSSGLLLGLSPPRVCPSPSECSLPIGLTWPGRSIFGDSWIALPGGPPGGAGCFRSGNFPAAVIFAAWPAITAPALTE
ncbi:Uncharacterised protein [Mycobacteroides abscessus subsp. abscessus]|nr:Uncharacterised protein [Mycobacteroides abscessus subsp. abscessus]SLG75198.1 Uncharacterised protein [Mycobacteroides abscessus subsp. abscessus]